MTTHDALRTITDLLSSQKASEPQANAKVIVWHVMGQSDIMAEVPQVAWRTMLRMAERAAKGEPTAYITGKAYFRYLALSVTKDVLIPRKETEQVAGEAIALINQNGYTSALDMCTGSGCIAISLATETNAKVSAADISAAAIDLAKQNAKDNNAEVDFFVSDMFSSVSDSYDLIVCNPPYISDADVDKIDPCVKDFEPALALFCSDGLNFYRIIAQRASDKLLCGGALVLEIGADQAQDVTALLTQSGFKAVECKKDYQDRDRIVTAYK
jgi:release factor glutamine methyltransferase